jgi:tRNA pseudouridine55 synthase
LPKSYLTAIRLGQETETYDAEGEIIRERPVEVTEKQLLQAIDQFRGHIDQLPPMFSAVKHEGQPLYKYARQGQSVPRSPRTVTVHKIEIENWESPNLELLIDCSSGTYIRSLAHDLGNSLQCGGHVASLRRTAIGAHTIDQAVSADGLTKENWASFLNPAEKSVSHLPKVHLSTEDAKNIMHGQQVPINDDHLLSPFVQAYDSDGYFVGVLESEGTSWHGKKVFYGLSRSSDQLK